MSRKCFWDRDWDAPVSGYIGHFFPCSYIRWLDWIFFWGRGYLPSLSINYIKKSKDMEKKVTTTILYKDENFFVPGFYYNRSRYGNVMTPLLFLFIFVFLCTRSFFFEEIG